MKLPVVLLVAAAGAALSFGAFRSANGTEVRAQTTYYANGQVDTEFALKDGQRDGICRRYYSDGSRLAEGNYSAGRMEGEWTFWLRGGEIDAERSGTYAAGVKVRG